jgi:hypothetical protein
MASVGAVLILKGEASAIDILDALDHLLDREKGDGQRPKPCQLFSLICASGSIG